jgi:tape measure domain-containing protein
MGASVGSVSVDLDAKIAKFESDIGRAARLLEKEMGRAASMAERAMQRASKEISSEMDRIAKKAEQFGKQLLTYFAVTSLVGYLRDLAAVADSFANIQAKVKLATGEQVNLAKATQDVYEVSQRTYNSFESTAALVQRTAGALRSAGRGYQEAFETGIRLAEVFNKSLVVSGASSSESAAAALQFSQALASGKFQGDEFKSVMENNSRFAKLLADSLGITTAQLREMSTAGKLNVESMLGVLKNTAALDAEFAKMPVTIGRATTQLSNAWTKFIGETDQASGASRKVAAAIQAIADHIPEITSVLVTLGEIAIVVFATKMAGAAFQAGKAIAASAAQAIAAETIYRALAVSTEVAAVASTRMATGMAALSVAGRGMLALVGGLPGLLIAAAAALVYFATRATEVSEEVERLHKVSEELEKRSLSLSDALKLLATGAEPAKKSLRELKEAQLDELEAVRARAGFNGEILKSFQANGFALISVRSEIEKLRAAEAEVNLAHIKAEFSDVVRVIGGAVNAVINWRDTWKMALQRSVVADPDLAKEAEQMEKHAMQLGKTKVQYYELVKAKELDTVATKANAKEGTEAYKILIEAIDKKYERVMAAAKAEDVAAASVKAHKQEVRDKAKEDRDATSAVGKYENAMEKLADMADRSAKEMGPLSKVEHEHQIRLREISEATDDATASARKMVNAKEAEEKVHAASKKALDAESDAYKRNVSEAKKALDITTKYRQELSDRVMTAGMSDRDAFAYDYAKRYREELEKLGPEAIKAGSSIDQMTAEMRDSAAAAYEAEKSAQFWRSTWESAVNDVSDVFARFATGQIKSAKDLGKALTDVFKQTFQKIIAEMIRSGIMKMFASFFGGGSGGGGGGFWGTLIAGAAAYLGSGSSGGVSVSQNTANGGIDLSSQQTGGFQYGGSGGSGGGFMDYIGNYATGKGTQYVMGAGGSWVAANSGAIGYAGGITGALAGAYYGSTRGDGGVGTVTGIAAGAIAGYYAGTVAASALIGASAGAATGVTGAAAAGAAGGASGAVAAIPVIGWVAAIVLAIDAISGGKALGTRYRPHTLQTDISFGADGPSATAELEEWKYRRNIFQFNRGGSLEAMRRFGERQYRTSDFPIDPELMAALEKVAKSIDKTAQNAAEYLNTETIAALDASFQTLVVYDKKGRVKRTETLGTILGKEYRESWEQFQVRMHAETIIATIGQVNSIASSIAEAYRKNADELLDAAGAMLQTMHDLEKGQGLLGAGGTLESTMEWLEKQRVGDEKLVETYARLAQATAQYRDILDKAQEAIDSLTRGSTPLDQMNDAIKQINKNLDDNIAALNAAAVAAGLTAASEKDLAKLRELQAAQINKLSTDFFASIDQQITQLTYVATPAGDFAMAMHAIADTMKQNEAIAQALARAQGRSGASAEELYKIHELGARQMAAAIKKLEDVARQQARSLGYLGLETVDDYDARIAELEGKANAAAEAVGSFGSAMSSTAAAAQSAVDLLLGALSPLNDQQKLQYALSGLYGGTVTQEQVLEIGRRLYASSQQYTDLFNQVMNVRPRNTGGDGSRGGGGSSAAPEGLTTAEQQELIDLRLQREEKVRQQRYNEALEFANTIASLAAAQGLSFEQVAENIGFDLEDLGKDLGLSVEDLLKYLGNIDVNATAVPDSITSNFDRLLAALDKYWGDGSTAENPDDGPAEDPGRLATGNASDGRPGAGRGGLATEDTGRDVLAGMQEYTRSTILAGDRNAARVSDSVDRNTDAIDNLSRDFREGFGDRPRSVRIGRDPVRT